MWIEYLIETKLTLRWPFYAALEIFLNAVVYVPVLLVLAFNFAGTELDILFFIGPIIGAVLSLVFLAVGFAQKKNDAE